MNRKIEKRWIVLPVALGAFLTSVHGAAREVLYVTHGEWASREGFCYNHDEYYDTTPTMDARPAGQASYRPLPDLDCWLTQAHPDIAQQIYFAAPTDQPGFRYYAEWTPAQKQALAIEFARAWNWFEGGYNPYYVSPDGQTPPPPTNLAPASGGTILGLSSAWSLYTQYMGVLLAAQLGHWFTWDIRWQVWMSTEDRRQLLSSNYMFLYFAAHPTGTGTVDGYAMDAAITGTVTPTPALAQLDFLRQIGAIHASQADTVYAALDWGRDNLAHFNGGYDAATELAVWQYPGYPPISSIISGTKSTAPSDASFPSLHWTAGCHGTSGFYKSVLRTAMIPVTISTACGHSQMHFPMNWLETFISHSDAIYSRSFRDENLGTPWDLQYPPTSPLHSTSKLVFYERDYDTYFSPANVSAEQSCTNVNVSETAFAGGIFGNQTNSLMSDYCYDVAHGLDHANGHVYLHNFVNPFYNLETTGVSLAYLELLGLWYKLEAKRQQYGCARFPP